MADPRSEPSMEDILASIKRIIADEPEATPRPTPSLASAPLSAPTSALRAPSVAAPQPPMPRTADPVSPVAQSAPAPVPTAAAPRPDDRDAPPPWPNRMEPPAPPESVLELSNRAPGPSYPRDAAPSPTPASADAPPVQRAVERLRQAETELPPATPRPVPRDLLPRTPTPRPGGGDITLDALAREMLQPMLADWIDRNLPDMVERMVQAEIRRMIDKEA